MSRSLLLSALLALTTISPAAAECVAVIAELQERIVTLEGQERPVEVRSATGRIEVERAPGGVQPTESWGGATSGMANVSDKLRNARRLAQNGDEDGCLVLVEEARIIVRRLVP